jgi:hypothetical protein
MGAESILAPFMRQAELYRLGQPILRPVSSAIWAVLKSKGGELW